MPLHSGTDSSDWVWILQEIFTLALSMRSILLGTLVTHSSCLHLHSLSPLLHAAPLRFPCRILSLTRSLPSWSAWKKTHQMSPISLEKRPTPGQEAEAAFLQELYGFQVTWCDMMWHYITVLSLVMHRYGTRCWSEVWSVKRFKIATRASNIWRMMELFLQRGPKRLQFAARHGKTEATKSIYKPCSEVVRLWEEKIGKDMKRPNGRGFGLGQQTPTDCYRSREERWSKDPAAWNQWKKELLHAEHRLAGEKNLATGQFKKCHSSAPKVNLSVIPAACVSLWFLDMITWYYNMK